MTTFIRSSHGFLSAGLQSYKGRLSVVGERFNKDVWEELWKRNVLPKINRNTESTKDEIVGNVPTKTLEALAPVLSYVKEYWDRSTIHGFRYLSEEHRNNFEKLFWATAILISTVGCGMMIATIKTKMDTTPMVVTLAENPTKVWHAPFPAVTVFSRSPSRLTPFNLTKFLHLMATNHTFMEDFMHWVNDSKLGKDKLDLGSLHTDVGL